MNDATSEVSLAKDVRALLDDADSLLQHGVQGQAAESADELGHGHPWESIGVAAAMGVALGVSIARK